jgi:DNA-directed RNA polymerase subunit RPC12/RpoP
MTDIICNVIPQPDESSDKSVLHGTEGLRGKPLITGGDGQTSYICGQCNSVLAEKINELQINNVVLQCTTCNSYNELPK